MPASLQLLYHQKKIITLQTVQSCYRKLCIVVTEIGALLLPISEHSRLPKSVHFSLPFTLPFTLTAHGLTSYYNNKKRGELDFVIELSGRILPIEVKSGKYYEVHRALSNILDCSEYSQEEAIVLNNGNLRKEGKILYAPVYMICSSRKRTMPRHSTK